MTSSCCGESGGIDAPFEEHQHGGFDAKARHCDGVTWHFPQWIKWTLSLLFTARMLVWGRLLLYQRKIVNCEDLIWALAAPHSPITFLFPQILPANARLGYTVDLPDFCGSNSSPEMWIRAHFETSCPCQLLLRLRSESIGETGSNEELVKLKYGLTNHACRDFFQTFTVRRGVAIKLLKLCHQVNIEGSRGFHTTFWIRRKL